MSNGRQENLFDVKYKVLLLGDTLVGKTSLQRFIAGKDFRTDIGATVGTFIGWNRRGFREQNNSCRTIEDQSTNLVSERKLFRAMLAVFIVVRNVSIINDNNKMRSLGRKVELLMVL
jgi:GTPase SAR1 family protein